MLKKIFAFVAFFMVTITFVPTFADIAGGIGTKPSPRVNVRTPSPIITIQRLNEREGEITLEVKLNNDNVSTFSYVVVNKSNNDDIDDGRERVDPSGKSIITLDYDELQRRNKVPNSLILTLKFYEQTVSTKYGKKKYNENQQHSSSRTLKTYNYEIKFMRDSQGKLSAGVTKA